MIITTAVRMIITYRDENKNKLLLLLLTGPAGRDFFTARGAVA
jgi:hypothetical protein